MSKIASYSTTFKEVGTARDDYIVKLKEGAVPFALRTPRNVSIPLREKVREELTRMENMGMISKVRTHFLVRWDRGRAKTFRSCANLCRFKTP